MDKKDRVFNKRTNRWLKKGSLSYIKALSLGELELPPEAEPQPEPEVPPVKAKLIETMTDIVAQNKPKFAQELTQKQTDALLKKMLYEKLCVSKKKPKKAKKKKSKFKIVEPPSSSSEEESDSD